MVGGHMAFAASSADEDRFARMALWASLITSQQFVACVDEQIARAMDGRDIPSLAELLIERGHIDRREADAVFEAMSTHKHSLRRDQFGQIALRNAFVTGEQVRECLEEQRKLVTGTGSGPILGHILLERGYMTDAEVLDVLRTQQQRRLGALHELRAALRPTRPRLARLVRRYRRPLISFALLVGIAVAGMVGAWLHTLAAAPRLFGLVCDRCGHRARVPAAAIAQPCAQCGQGGLFAPLRCSKCRVVFPLKLHATKSGGTWIEPCPKCGTLRDVTLPPGVEAISRASPTTATTSARDPMGSGG